jgi:hypothetical protein
MIENWIVVTKKYIPWIFPEGHDETSIMAFEGFVYLITNLSTGRMYVGRKYLRIRRKRVIKESDWRTYYGSSKEIKEDVKRFGVENFKREILILCDTKAKANYEEVAEQFRRDVLHAKMPDGSRAYYNGNIMSRWFVDTKPRTHSENTRTRISEKMKALPPRSEETNKKLSEALTGRTLSETHVASLSRAKKGKAPPNKGTTYGDNIKQNISNGTKAAMSTPEVQQRLAEGYRRRAENLRKKVDNDTTRRLFTRESDEVKVPPQVEERTDAGGAVQVSNPQGGDQQG